MTRLPSLAFRPFLAFLALLSGVAGTAQKAPSAQDETPIRYGLEFVNLGELVLDQYEVMNVDPGGLFQVADSMIGRRFSVKEDGPGSAPVTSVRQLGRTIVLYDTKEHVRRARELLERLDQAGARQPAPQPIEYRPRFVSLKTAMEAIVDIADYSLVMERGLIVLHDSTPAMESALALLRRIDEPEKQVLLTCLLLEVGASGQGPGLPRELTDNLQRLLPQSSFAQVGMAMLKTSVGGQDPLSVQIESTGKRYRFSLVPVAFDEETGSLNVTDCKLLEEAGDGSRELFRTNTVLRGGEYTVLAATGATPRLLVVRVSPQD